MQDDHLESQVEGSGEVSYWGDWSRRLVISLYIYVFLDSYI